MKKLIAMFLTLLLTACACAETITFDGVAVSTATQSGTFTYGGAIDAIKIYIGDHVEVGDVIYTLTTSKVYAARSGILRLFGDIGDDCSDVTARYGAVAYIEPDVQYTIEASTSYAYDHETNRIIHPGESVYLRSHNTYSNTGIGIVTAVSGTSFTVEVTSGSFSTGDSINVFRAENYDSVSRIGRGKITHVDPISYEGSGLIVSFDASNGDHISKGQILFETVSGTYYGERCDLTEVTADTAGVITSLNAAKGAQVSAGEVAYEIYPDSALRIEMTVGEADLASISVGMDVDIELPYYMDGSIKGTIEKISRVGEAISEDDTQAGYKVYVIPENNDAILYGMNALIIINR